MAASVDMPTTEDLTGTTWRDDGWLAHFPLISATALDYFSFSPFYVRENCNNEKLKQNGWDLSKLSLCGAGVEYLLQDAQEPHLFVIRKQWRRPVRDAQPATQPMAFYYILDGSVYQAPTLHSALSSRMNRCLYNMRSAFRRMQTDLDPLRKEHEQGGAEPGAPAVAPPPPKRRLTQEQREKMVKNDRILMTVLAKHPLPGQPGTTSAGVPPADSQLPSVSQQAEQQLPPGDASVMGPKGPQPQVTGGRQASSAGTTGAKR